MLEIGSIIDGKYKILSEIGHGGMSTVYLAINEKANKTWAVKEVRKTGTKDFELVRQSLMVETDLLKKLKHPNLPSIVDVIDETEDFLIVMDFIEGNTLEQLLCEQGEQKQEDVVKWAIELCNVLSYLHRRTPQIIYRDMKPSNVMLKPDSSVMLIDFGTAREYKGNKESDTTCLGTQGYAAPEQFGGMGQTDPRTDIYCLGATMYHLVTGHNPSSPPYEMYPITHWNPRLSTGLENIIVKCTQRNPQDRYQSAEELAFALKHYRELDKSAMEQYRKRVKLFVGTATMALFCMVASAGFFIASQGKRQNEYRNTIYMAEKITDTQEALDLYTKAITIDPVREEAYGKLYERMIADGIYQEEEETRILRLNTSTDKYLYTFSEKNPAAYADFCYNMGNAYWFYYTHEESRQSYAVAWFASAMKEYAKREEKKAEYSRSVLYVEIGSFYKKIVAAQIDGTDAGMYGEYWSQLVKLKQLNDRNPDRELVTLRMYREIVSRSLEYAKYLQEDGITRQEILEMYESIRQDMRQMEQNATSAVKEEIGRIQSLFAGTDNMINSCFGEGEEV